ncbi:MAG TPA: ferredoxin [Candidatus Binataceae bacterium]|jgi:ferredoxin|nr:ferredoxin [Candidatus Binataceae bacterium]
MKVVVDRQACEGNGKCVEVAAEVFEVKEDDRAVVKLDNPPANLNDKIKLAVRLCPRQAISIRE